MNTNRAIAVVLGSVFLVAIAVRVPTLWGIHTEGDEMLYAALVEQLEQGRGYTLQGHPLLERPSLAHAQYDRPLFYHPPGGVGFFWLLEHFFPSYGMGVAQLVSVAVFYWSMVGLGRALLRDWTPWTAVAIAGPAAFTPIVAHVHTHWWLDGPQLAFATAGTALFVAGLRRAGAMGVWMAAAAGVMLAWSCLTKMNAVVLLPLVLALAWSVEPRIALGRLATRAAIAFGIVGLALAPWLWAQWVHFGELFPTWAGKPAPELVTSNPFVWFVTTVRGPWSYVRLLPQAMCTLVPAIFTLPWLVRERRTRPIVAVLCVWIVAIVGLNVALGYLGYSKLLRYAILVVPAVILWLALAVEAAMARRRGPRGAWATAVLVALAIAFCCEVSLGVAYATVYDDRALILLYPDLEMMRRGG